MIIGHKHITEAMDFIIYYRVVGEHSCIVEGELEDLLEIQEKQM